MNHYNSIFYYLVLILVHKTTKKSILPKRENKPDAGILPYKNKFVNNRNSKTTTPDNIKTIKKPTISS